MKTTALRKRERRLILGLVGVVACLVGLALYQDRANPNHVYPWSSTHRPPPGEPSPAAVNAPAAGYWPRDGATP